MSCATTFSHHPIRVASLGRGGEEEEEEEEEGGRGVGVMDAAAAAVEGGAGVEEVVEEEEEEEEEEEKEKEVVVVAVAAAVASTQWSDCAYGFQRALPLSAFVTSWSSSCSPMPPTPATSACLCGPLR